MNRLMLGSGIFKREGWKTLDMNAAMHPDFVGRIPGTDIGQECWDEIEWVHGIGSVCPFDAATALVEIYEALKPGGRLALEQPDFDCCKSQADFFGDPSLRNPDHMNRYAYRRDQLLNMVLMAGFTNAAILPAQHHVPERDFRVEAWR